MPTEKRQIIFSLSEIKTILKAYGYKDNVLTDDCLILEVLKASMIPLSSEESRQRIMEALARSNFSLLNEGTLVFMCVGQNNSRPMAFTIEEVFLKEILIEYCIEQGIPLSLEINKALVFPPFCVALEMILEDNSSLSLQDE